MRADLLDSPFFEREGSLIVRRTPGDAVPYAYFEGAVPSRRQAATIMRNGYGLYVNGVPGAHRGLGFLQRFEQLTHLGLLAEAAETRKIEDLSNLRELRLMVSSAEEIDFTRMSRLATFSGCWRFHESVFEAPGIEEIFLEETLSKSIPSLPDSLRRLTVIGARSVRSLAARGPSPQLEELSIHRAPSFDVGSLGAFPLLRKTAFERVKAIENAGLLAELQLEELGLINCGSVDDPAVFGQLEFNHITVVGKLGETLRPFATNTSTSWLFLKHI
ncbi:hypothetical protein [Microbacterium sp. PMB16]|uniref:hypothetical protein n=1 Tax=Microbacterium sp. PMB16 TaxID=3120157 RepID=UPI003F4BEBA4